MVKINIDPKLPLRNLDARNEKIGTGAVVLSRRRSSDNERGKGSCCQWKAQGWCSRGDQCSLRHESHDREKPTPKAAPPSEPPTPRGRSASGKFNRQPCKYFLKGTCTSQKRRESDKNAVVIEKIVPQLGCVSQDSDARWFLKEQNSPGETRCKKSWDRFEEYDSHSLRCVKQVSEKIKAHRLEKYKSKNLHQRSPYAMKFEDRSHEETDRQ